MKKKILYFNALLIVSVILAGCTPTSPASTMSQEANSPVSPTDVSSLTPISQQSSIKETANPVNITFYNTSAEINSQFENLFKIYMTQNPDVTVELIPSNIGQGQMEKYEVLYASGSAPSLSNLDASYIVKYKDKLLEFSTTSDPYLNQALPGALEGGTFDGKLLSIPFTVQGYGLMYNKEVVDRVMGKGFDSFTIRTRDDLETLLKKIDSTGVAATQIHGSDWSLGSHFLGMVYATHSKDTAGGARFLEDLKAGKVKLIEDPIFNGYMDTLDLLAKYNLKKDDPLSADYNHDVLDFVRGRAATFFMGDWMWSVANSIENKSNSYGILPVPWSNNPSDYGNTQITVFEAKLFAIDKSQNTPEQQIAARKLLEWILTSDEGQKMLVTEAGFSMPYRNVKFAGSNPMTLGGVNTYSARGLIINFGVYAYYPLDTWKITGASMQKYLIGKIDRKTLAAELEDYWKAQAEK